MNWVDHKPSSILVDLIIKISDHPDAKVCCLYGISVFSEAVLAAPVPMSVAEEPKCPRKVMQPGPSWLFHYFVSHACTDPALK